MLKKISLKLINIKDYFFCIFYFFLKPRKLLKFCLGEDIFKIKKKYLERDYLKNFSINNNIKDLRLNEINLICRGHSYKKYKREINLEYPTFFVNYYDNDQIESGYEELEKTNEFFGITTDIKIKKKMKKIFNKTILILNAFEKSNSIIKSYWEDMKTIDSDVVFNDNSQKKIFETLNNEAIVINFNNEKKQIDLGSTLISIFFLSHFVKKINVYGYDHHFKKPISHMNLLEILYNCWNERTKLHPKPIKHAFIKTLINFYFSNQFENDDKFKIKTNLNGIGKHYLLTKKLGEIFINPI